MAYDEALAGRVRSILSSREGFGEKTLFGGLTFSINGNMVCSVNSQGFTLSAGSKAEELLKMPNMKPKMLGPKPMNGMVIAEAPAYETDDGLKMMVDMAADVAAAKPPKQPKKPKQTE